MASTLLWTPALQFRDGTSTPPSEKQIKLHRLLQPLASRLVALAKSRPAAKLHKKRRSAASNRLGEPVFAWEKGEDGVWRLVFKMEKEMLGFILGGF